MATEMKNAAFVSGLSIISRKLYFVCLLLVSRLYGGEGCQYANNSRTDRQATSLKPGGITILKLTEQKILKVAWMHPLLLPVIITPSSHIPFSIYI